MRFKIIAVFQDVEIVLASTNIGAIAKNIAMLYCGEKSGFDFVDVIDTEDENNRTRYVPSSQFNKIGL